MMIAKEAMKCACLMALFVLLSCLIALTMRIDAIIVQAQTNAPLLIERTQSNLSKQLDAKLDPTITKANAALAGVSALTASLKRVSDHINAEIPAVKDSLTTETVTLNAKLDTLNASVWQAAHPLEPLQPTIDGLNLMFRKDELPKAIPALVRDYRRVGDEVAQTMITVRDTVKVEAGPTALAVRKSAEGTAKTTDATATLINHVDDLFFGPKTWKQKLMGWVRLLLAPGAILGAKAF